jgi:hypothetical protein
LLTLTGVTELFAQYESDKQAAVPLEYFYVKKKKTGIPLLSKITFGLSTGVGISYFRHTLNGFGIQQNPGEAPLIYTGNSFPQYGNWFNTTLRDTLPVLPSSFRVSSDSATLGFKGRGLNIPIKATLHYEWKRYRIGGGISYEYMTVGNFRPLSYKNEIAEYSPAAKGGFMRKIFGMAGVAVYRYQYYLLVVDAQIGSYKPSRTFNLGQIQKGIYYNVGLTIERDMSEYLRLFVRPSYDIKNFTLSVPETGLGIKHRFNALYLNIGATYRFPELRRCVIDGCRAQVNHAHGNKEYRSKVHPIYKKQNPYYGENYPRLIKYKGKNNRKLNPY